MTINEYIRIIRRRGWIVVIAALLAAAAAFGISYFQEDEYRAIVHVSVVPARADWGLTNSATELMRNFAANVQTPEVAQLVINNAQLDQNPYAFLGNTSVVPDPSTFSIDFEARNRDGQVAKQMAIAYADFFEAERTLYYAQQDKRDRINVQVRSRAIDAPQIRPRPITNAVAGGVLGMLLGIAVVLGLTWVEADLLRTPEAVERALGLSVIGAIPTASGPKEIVQPASQSGRISAPEAA